MAAPGVRTLVVDGDLHRRKLTDALAPGAREGLIEALDDPSRLATLVVKRDHSGLDILPCVAGSRIPNAAELLGSAKMERLLAGARESYDYIILENPSDHVGCRRENDRAVHRSIHICRGMGRDQARGCLGCAVFRAGHSRSAHRGSPQ
jgi:hypothetical protein